MKSRSHASFGYFFRKPPGCHFLGSMSGGMLTRSSSRSGYLFSSSLNRSSASPTWAIIAFVASTFAFSARLESCLMTRPATMPMMTMTTIISIRVNPAVRGFFTTALLDIRHFQNRQQDGEHDEPDHDGHHDDHQ